MAGRVAASTCSRVWRRLTTPVMDLCGGRVSLPVALVVVIAESVLGTLYRALAAYLGGWFDDPHCQLAYSVIPAAKVWKSGSVSSVIQAW